MSNTFSEIPSVHQLVYESFKYAKSGDLETAVSMCFDAARSDPENPTIYFVLGKHLGQQEKHELSSEQFSKSIDLYCKNTNICPNLFEACYLSSLNFYCLKQYEKAFKYVDMALDFTPHDSPRYPKYLMHVSAIAFACSKWQEAANIADQVLQINPGDDMASLIRQQALLRLARV